MLLLLFPMGVQDLLWRRLNIWWMLTVGLAGGLYHIIFTEWGPFELLAGGLTGGVLLLLSLKSSGIGSGDGIFFLAVGEIVGFVKCFVLLEQSLLLCFAVGMVLHICLHKSKEYRIPMAPIVMTVYLLAAITEGGV